MLNSLKIINLAAGSPLNEQQVLKGNIFTLRTCQRTLILGFNQGPFQALVSGSPIAQVYDGPKAYQFLLETICGLKSQIIGENEIVHQFKKAYQSFMQSSSPNSTIINLLEKLFTDAKKIRTQHLLTLGLQTYSGIVRKILNSKPVTGPIVILGSGQLCEDIIKNCGKKYEFLICARNELAVQKICDQSKENDKLNISSLPWSERNKLSAMPYIINTIGTEKTLIGPDFFNAWNGLVDKVFIDLATPSPIKTTLTKSEGFINLQCIFDLAKEFNADKEEKINQARQAIAGAARDRGENYTFSSPFGWDELQFA